MPELQPTRCAICGTEGNSNELYPANLDLAALNPANFSARRVPDRRHFRLVRCRQCGLVRSDPVADSTTLEQLYRQSAFTYGSELPHLKRTYGKYLDVAGEFCSGRDALLEIGCGNGFFLEEALARGWRTVRGVEPSLAAAEKASGNIRPCITCEIMRQGLFAPGSFDMVCMFQVFDHFPDPRGVLNACHEVLRTGGLVLAINHNMEAMSARLLGERSPIFDIEHTFLWSGGTMSQVFSAAGFEVLKAGSVLNRFSLAYLAHLSPLPAVLKRHTLACLEATGLARLPLSLPLGNLFLVARKTVKLPHVQERPPKPHLR
jgi:SAM-dependent methyltransferase